MPTLDQSTATEPLPLPSAPSVRISEIITIQPPLSRRGRGPALILLSDNPTLLVTDGETLDPPPLRKWAEEGFAVAQVALSEANDISADVTEAINTLERLGSWDESPEIGVITYLSSANDKLSEVLEGMDRVAAVVSYGPGLLKLTGKPHLVHVAGKTSDASQPENKSAKLHLYPSAGPFFVCPGHADYHSSSASVSHTRTLTFLKPLLNGPYFELEAIWEEHCLYEFGERAVEKTMATMVQEPYVNHVPTITGGIGRDKLTSFYRHHFIFSNPDDTALELISRTVGIDRVIDEFIFSFTHDRTIDWLIPGIPPTGKHVKVPFTSIVNIRGDRLYHEHIAWDQASVLVQLGLMPQYLPFPYQVDGRSPEPGKRFEYRVPAAGIETAQKLIDENTVESNGMFEFGVREVDDV